MFELVCFRTEEYEKEALDDTKWIDEYSTQEDDLAKTAKELLSGVTDPKLANSEVHMTHFCLHTYLCNVLHLPSLLSLSQRILCLCL